MFGFISSFFHLKLTLGVKHSHCFLASCAHWAVKPGSVINVGPGGGRKERLTGSPMVHRACSRQAKLVYKFLCIVKCVAWRQEDNFTVVKLLIWWFRKKIHLLIKTSKSEPHWNCKLSEICNPSILNFLFWQVLARGIKLYVHDVFVYGPKINLCFCTCHLSCQFYTCKQKHHVAPFVKLIGLS